MLIHICRAGRHQFQTYFCLLLLPSYYENEQDLKLVEAHQTLARSNVPHDSTQSYLLLAQRRNFHLFVLLPNSCFQLLLTDNNFVLLSGVPASPP